jgi:hypothetical protein
MLQARADVAEVPCRERRPKKKNSESSMNSKLRREPVTAAERMRVHRTRRRNGLRCVRVLLHETEIDQLDQKGFLKPERRHDHDAVENAMGSFVCGELVPADR